MTKACQIGEDALVERLVALMPMAACPRSRPGDDCALIERDEREPWLVKTDSLVEGVHYFAGESGLRVGWKAVARVVSDFAASGGSPFGFLVSIALSAETPVEWLEDVYRGMARCMAEFGGFLAGGETVSLPKGAPMVLTVMGMGYVKHGAAVFRHGGQAGDFLYVTGSLGGSIQGKHLDFRPRVGESSWLVENGYPTAMMDLSDGLAKDLPRLSAASDCGYCIDPDSIPCTEGCSFEQALTDGEDYELLFAVRPCDADSLESGWKREFPDLLLSRIGALVAKDKGESLRGGWDHFDSGHPSGMG